MTHDKIIIARTPEQAALLGPVEAVRAYIWDEMPDCAPKWETPLLLIFGLCIGPAACLAHWMGQ